MKKFLIPAALAAAALLTSQAQASDMLRSSAEFYAGETPVVENVRMVCNEFGRCWREPSRRTVIIEDSYNAPRERYIEAPGERYIEAPRERYIERRYREDRPAAGIGIHAPGVSVGVGVDDDRW